MSEETKTAVVLALLTALYLGLYALFFHDGFRAPPAFAAPARPGSAFTNTATVRLSGAERIRDEGEVDDFDCYICHEQGKEPVLKFGPHQELILPDEHSDLVMRHGESNRNDNCFNCHNPKQLDQLRTRDGQALTFAESTLLCASCHGPTFRDWKIGIHGRVSGYWNRQLGGVVRKDCTSCHDPHAPAFPAQPPAPGPARPHAPSHPAPEGDTHDAGPLDSDAATAGGGGDLAASGDE